MSESINQETGDATGELIKSKTKIREKNWLGWGFCFLGTLVGVLTGLTSAEITVTLVTVVFAFLGGSVVAMVQKISIADREAIGKIIFSFSFSCVVFLILGIIAKQNEWLTPMSKRGKEERVTYIRSGEIDIIDNKLRQGVINYEEAYNQLKLNLAP
jgi:hypothetical protein